MPREKAVLTSDLAGAALGALTGASAWISAGTLAIVDAETGSRVGVVLPLWSLTLLAAVGAIAAWRLRLTATTAAPLAITVLLWLPWLPVGVPTAFLMWHGTLEIAVWAAALGGVALSLAPALARASTSPLARRLAAPSRAPVAAALVAATCYAAAAFAVRDRLPAGDEPHYLIITQSLLLDGDLRIENNHARGDYAEYFTSQPLRPHYISRGADGEIYSIHAPGLPALVLPAFALGGYPATVLFMALVAGAATGLAWHAAWLLTASAVAAWVGWAGVAFSAPFFFHGFTVYPDGVAAMLTMFGVWVLLGFDRKTVPLRAVAATGTALALLPWLHARFAVIAAVLGLAVAGRLVTAAGRARALAAFLAVPIVSAAGWFGFFQVVYGSPSPAAPYGHNPETSLAHIWPGIVGLLADQQFGVLPNAPLLAVPIAGAWLLARGRPRLAAELGLLVAAYTCAVAAYPMWWAGYSAPGRFLVAVLPLAALPLALVWSRAGRMLRLVIAALGGVSVFLIAARLFAARGHLLHNIRDGYDLLLDWVSRIVSLPLALPSVHRDGAAMAAGGALVWITLLGGAAIALLWLDRRRRLGSPAAWTAACLTFASAAMLAATVHWRFTDEAVRTPFTSQLELLQQWNPRWQTVAIGLPAFSRAPAATVPPSLTIGSSERNPRRQPDALLWLTNVPAGDYTLLIDGAAALDGTLTLTAGRTAQPLERWRLDGRAPGDSGLRIRLPALTHSLVITGDGEAHATVARLAVRPDRIEPPAGRFLAGPYAWRAGRYGRVRVFFLDEASYPEATGFWAPGDGETRVLLDADHGRPQLRLRNGPVENLVALEVDRWVMERRLEPGEAWDAPHLPEVTGSPLVLRIAAEAGFMPSRHEPGSDDHRYLGVWVEVD